MANIIRRRGSESQVPSYGQAWDPFRMMQELLEGNLPAWNETRQLAFAPTFEVKETRDSYVFKADLPGVKESDLEISLTNNRLVVGGKRDAEQREESDKFYAYERSFGSFSRAFTLPDG